MKYEQSIKTLESAKKSLELLVERIDEQISKQLRKIDEFNTKIFEYGKAIRKLSTSEGKKCKKKKS